MPAPDGLTDVAGAILDGDPIDWPAAESRVTDAERGLLEELKLLAALASLHRGQPHAAAGTVGFIPPTVDGAPLLQWGPLRVLEPIARGAFGEVYRAWDTRLDREVALKLLPSSSAPAERDSAAVIREGRLLARVHHPNVVAIYGAEQIENRIGLWMEFVRGRTLEEALEEGRVFSVAEAVHIGMELCQAVAAVHEAGLLHRDIKAQNVALADDGRVVLMDFGAGREAADPLSPDLTGTPLYLAPEIFDGQPASVRSDIYGVGVVLFRLVTNAFPVHGRTVHEIRERHLRGERIEVSALRPDVPDRFVEIIDRALASSPGRRYDTALSMRAALGELLPNATVPLRPVSPRMVWSALAAVLIAVTAAWLALNPSSAAPAPTPSEWVQVTNFGDSATAPALSPDGRMLTFIRGADAFFGPGDIYIKAMPDGPPVPLTTFDGLSKMDPVFSPDGSHIAYTSVDTATFHWDTWLVPVRGRGAPRVLRNASGLTWIDRRRLLFSEMKHGIHMALVTATEDRRDARDVYVPPHERGMVHRSALSPDRRWVIAVEMENQLWLPCRLLPFDGRDSGKPIGPAGAPCTAAAWSPDGAWMYVNANAGGNFHIWRQRFPDGTPVQVTSGPTEERGIAVAPDGRSLITSVGITTSSVWLHDQHGARQISSEGSASLPGQGASEAIPRGSYFSPDDRKLYYLVRRGGGATFLDGELWVADLASGQAERVSSGFTIGSFDISDEGTRVVFAAADARGKPRLWLASLDGPFVPRQLSFGDDDSPMFAPNGEIFFRSSEGGANFLYRIKGDGTGRRKVVPTPILAAHSVSPDGGWIVAYTPLSGEDVAVAAFAYPTAGGPAIRVCNQCKISWSRDGTRWYVSVPWNGGRTYVVKLRSGAIPALGSAGIRSEADLQTLPVIEVIDEPRIAPGRDPSTYAFTRMTTQRNLYRIPLP